MEAVASESQIKSLFSAAQNYDAAQARLRALAPRVKGTPLERDYMATLQRGESIKANVAATLFKARDAWNYVKTALGRSWDAAIKSAGLGELGFVPVLIGAGLVLTAIAAMSKWIMDAQAFEKRVAIYEAERAKGTSPQVASNIAFQQTQAKDSGVVPDFGSGVAKSADAITKVAKWALIGFAAWKGYKYAQKKGWV